MTKNALFFPKSHFILAYYKKKQYLCTVKSA